jgi:coenzyme F420 hydrogenase subunit beta
MMDVTRKTPVSVEHVRNQWLCHGCGMCKAVCPRNAIEMIYDNRRRSYVPSIAAEKCISCSVCVEVCPGIDVNFDAMARQYLNGRHHDILAGHWIENRLAWATNDDIRFRASSGGVATALGIYLLESGRAEKILAVTTPNSNPMEFQGTLIDDPSKVHAAMGSKYCSVPLCSAFRNLSENDRIAAFGLPCHIHAIRKAQSQHRLPDGVDLTLIGLFCGGTKGRDATKWIIKRNNLDSSKIVSINYRGDGWPGCLAVEFEDGARTTLPYPDYADLQFHSFGTWRCTLCSDGLSELADISIGDAWLEEITSADHQGVSMVITRSEKGTEILEAAASAGALECSKAGDSDAMKSQYNMLLRKKHGIAASKLLAKSLGRGIPDYDNTAAKPSFSPMAARMKQELLWLFGRWSTQNRLLYRLVNRV